MLIYFSKMQGLGNDFMIIENLNQNFLLSKKIIKKLSNRNLGIGFDQLLLVEKHNNRNFDFFYRIFNANGSEVENCGNGARCLAKFLFEKRLTKKNLIHVETYGGKLILYIKKTNIISVNMGKPLIKGFKKIKTNISYFKLLELFIVRIGNPHAVLIVSNINKIPVNIIGKFIENNLFSTEKFNVGFMQIISPFSIKLRVFERGVGETLACGTGACAAVSVGITLGYLHKNIKVVLPGGKLKINWTGGLNHSLYMIGSVKKVFDGCIFLT
ncbi:diaminopimelate epimerase [Candidatus Portiera aleyrodidarum]|uniref:Diaminopimelate epimerase n=1 Tax=Candidatus Portiera aleyrodidarum TaxID=91844 RepID=A0A8D9JT35_9GAMM|nr:diaminopimelate epimerase [Candidatus Portiera aleyrodidarum]CEI58866.1 Diaminopimelate epimerase [Candidatus Portiera aleyrodidarum]